MASTLRQHLVSETSLWQHGRRPTDFVPSADDEDTAEAMPRRVDLNLALLPSWPGTDRYRRAPTSASWQANPLTGSFHSASDGLFALDMEDDLWPGPLFTAPPDVNFSLDNARVDAPSPPGLFGLCHQVSTFFERCGLPGVSFCSGPSKLREIPTVF
eukprot:TRINITY_DN10286_c0_g1_i1.p1 TRINITY_DN10286_c0_g1~~TRINITY_DN10286_c0_g1_i1.p1  ORF type:complete len:157 (-),score=22.17 TRINITY_DN10286_c0_g1_i1:94-564(-)